MSNVQVLGKKLNAANFFYNPSDEKLRAMASAEEITTAFGSASYTSQTRSRNEAATQVIWGNPNPEQKQLIEEVLDYLKNKNLIQLDRTICQAPEFLLNCRLYITEDFAKTALMWGKTLFKPHQYNDPDFITITVPEWKSPHILIFPEQGLTFVLGTDYMGENKKSMLRHAMYRAKQKGWLGLHAGSKIVRIRQQNKLKDVSFLFFGLSGTGKTALSCHDHNLTGDEKIITRQDDVVMLRSDSSVLGTEKSFYIKTDGLSPQNQPVLYNAAINKGALLDNVWVDKTSKTVDFCNTSLTSNGRAVINRHDIASADNSIDMAKTNNIIFITRRNDIIPPLARLTPEQAAAYFMLGESMDTSASNPDNAGQSRRVVGMNPFIIGPEHEEGNRFLEILRNNPNIQCFLMNTGRVGASGEFKGEKITLEISAKFIELIARNQIKWEKDSYWGYDIATEAPGIDINKLMPAAYYEPKVYKKLCDALRKKRKEWLQNFSGLYPEIIVTV